MSLPAHRNRSVLTIPTWMRTRTGVIAVSLGALAVLNKALTLEGVTPARTAGTMLAIITVLSVGLAMILAIHIVRDRRTTTGTRNAWTLFAFSLTGFGLSTITQCLGQWLGGQVAEAMGFAALVLEVVALALTIPATLAIPIGTLTRETRIAAILDLATHALAGVLVFWIYGIQPAIGSFEGGKSGWPVAVISIFALLSLTWLGTLILVPFRTKDRTPWHGLIPLGASAVFLVVVEIVPTCHEIAFEGIHIHPLYLGSILFALATAIHAQEILGAQASIDPVDTPRLRFALPFASIGLVGILLFTSIVSRELWNANVTVLLPATFIALVFVVVRQTVVAKDNFTMAIEMQKAKEIAESANSARLQFLANISHDLRTPLNGVLGCAQILLREQTLSPKQKDLVRTMQGCGEHLRNLISDLLDLSKLEADRLELAPSAIELPGFLASIVKTFALEAENKNVSIELNDAPDLPTWIMCDRKRLQQILGNLVHNAIKFTDHGGVRLTARVEQGMLVYDVMDTGCGILPDKLGELFQPFHVVDERSIKLEGTGLGLSICKKLAQKMGGDIVVQSVLGKGSTFSVWLPLQEAEPVIEVQRTVVDYQGRRRRILVVDDKPANRIVLRTMLEPLDFLVEESGDAGSALEQIRFAKPDIVLLDLMMPGVDGFELCRQISALDIVPTPVCLAVSAMFGDEVRKRCLSAGFRELLNKPVHLDTLVESLRVYAGIEWTYGVIQPAPPENKIVIAAPEEVMVPPPSQEITAFIDLARRGFVRNLETRAQQLAHGNPALVPFARRVSRYVSDFKLRELCDWLSSLNTTNVHGSA